jgi:hypothetical protein
MHCGLLLLFTFYSNTENSDKNTLFGTSLIKIRQKEQGLWSRGGWRVKPFLRHAPILASFQSSHMKKR